MNEAKPASQLLTLKGKGALAQSAATTVPRATSTELGEEESCLAFGYLRGIRDQARSIEFRFAKSNRQAFPYGWLGPTQFNPSAGILLKFVGDLVYYVLIEGSNLNQLVGGAASLYDQGILRHRVTWVREMTRHELDRAGEGEITVEHIRMASCRPDEVPKDAAWLELFQRQL